MRMAAHLLVAAFAIVPASSAQAVERLDLDRAWTEARANNPGLAQAQAELAAARASLAIAKPLLPNPSLRAGIEFDAPFENLGERVINVELEQELPVFGTRSAAIEEAQARIEAARATLESSSQALYSQLRGAMAELAEATASRILKKELADAARDVASATRRRANAGSLAPADANLAEVEAATAFAELADAKASEEAAASRLCVLLGRQSCRGIEASWPVPSGDLATEDELVAEALERRADLAAARFQGAAADAAIRGAERARIPVPSLAVGYTRDQAVFPEQGLGFTKTDDFLGLSVRIPLPVWSQGGGAVALAHAERSAAEARTREVRSRIPAEVRAARSRFESARVTTERWDSVQPRIDETLGWMRRGFDAGALSLENYLVARDRLVRAHQGLLTSRRELVAAAAELDRAVGRSAPALEGASR